MPLPLELAGSNWFSEEVSLHEVAVQRYEFRYLGLDLHTFSNRGQAEPMRERDDRVRNRSVFRGCREPPGELPVHFQDVERKLPQ